MVRAHPSTRAIRLGRRLRSGALAVARGPVLAMLAVFGLLFAVAAPLALFLALFATYRLITPGNNAFATLLVWAGAVFLARYGVLWSLVAIRRLAGLTRQLSGQWRGVVIPDPYQPMPDDGHGAHLGRRLAWILDDPATWRDLVWIVTNALGGVIVALTPVALFLAGLLALFAGLGLAFPALTPGRIHPGLTVIGVAMLLLTLWVAPAALKAYFSLANWLLGPRGDVEMALRVRHLAETRAESVDSSAAEIRRIERDLHDGTQARLVAMGMTLSTAKDLLDTDPESSRQLMTEAIDASAMALAELRSLIRGIHPPVLADRGLVDAVRALALDCALRVHVDAQVNGRLAPPVESAAYFAVSELLANASKHSGARDVRVAIRQANGVLLIEVADDGCGGIDRSRGTGLLGIERRLAVFDGGVTVSSPAAGPSVIRLEIPCAS